jgi:cellulose synthase/poly-beta-1,6-N-acetylglucosamine synthase-like glycosyltransferase
MSSAAPAPAPVHDAAPAPEAGGMAATIRNSAARRTLSCMRPRITLLPSPPNTCLAIVPAYNEEGRIVSTVRDILEHAPDFDDVVVDDGSTDRTATLARSAGARVLRHPFNLGIGGAVQSGYQFALENGYDVAVQVDGDGQHDARYIGELLHHLRTTPDLNLVTGSRFIAADDR